MEEPITFVNSEGVKLFGIVHIPDQDQFLGKKIGINLLNPGIKYRVAPNRLNIKIARKLCENGYYVLRFDPAGVGDSEGELPDNVLVSDIWEKIQKALFVQDTMEANKYFVTKYNLDNLVLIGSCGGAITSILTSKTDDYVDGLCLIDVPVNLRTSKMTFADKVVEGSERADWLFSEYNKNLFSLKAWIRFFSFQTNFKALSKVFLMKINKYIKHFYQGKTNKKSIETLCEEKGLNKLFFESFEAFIQQHKSILFIIAENDPGTEVFKRHFRDFLLNENDGHNKYDTLVDLHEIEDANHIYTLVKWQESLIKKICGWLLKEFNPA